MTWLLSLLIGILGPSSSTAGGGPLCAPPARLGLEVVRAIPRGAPAFTEGLLFSNGFLYESSGLYGSSAINRIDPGTGSVKRVTGLGPTVFAEGLDAWNGAFALLTWHEGSLLRWRSGFDQPPDPEVIPYPRDGWGLTHDSRSWIASDGTDRLHFLEPRGFREIRTVHVRNENQPVPGLNELEMADGALFANLYPTPTVAKIDPRSGCVLGLLDLSPLRSYLSPTEAGRIDSDRDAVLNGIAFDPGSSVFYVAGKRWPLLFKLRILPSQSPNPRPRGVALQVRGGSRRGARG